MNYNEILSLRNETGINTLYIPRFLFEDGYIISNSDFIPSLRGRLKFDVVHEIPTGKYIEMAQSDLSTYELVLNVKFHYNPIKTIPLTESDLDL